MSRDYQFDIWTQLQSMVVRWPPDDRYRKQVNTGLSAPVELDAMQTQSFEFYVQEWMQHERAPLKFERHGFVEAVFDSIGRHRKENWLCG